MSVFRTTIRISSTNEPISLKSNIMTIGSCFSDAMGNRLLKMKFNCLVNPFGVIYNPISIHRAIIYSLNLTAPTHETYLERDHIHFNYDFHSGLSALKQEDLKTKLQSMIGDTHAFIVKTNYLVITYGTSFVYRRRDNGNVVANCHKVSSQFFIKELLSHDEICKSFDELRQQILNINPKIKIILTVSPVRHIKDTIELNSVSKSILRVACHTLSQQYENVEYFPAYEIMMDDLRDYRFYKSDMLHPNEDGEHYIWEKFCERYFAADTIKLLSEWNNILSALAHKPFHISSLAHQQFLKSTLKKLEELEATLNVEAEIKKVKEQII